MSNNIIKEFKSILNETDWMDAQSKKAALEKVKYFPKIGILISKI